VGVAALTVAADQLTRTVARTWDEAVLPALEAFIAIPNVSPAFDAGWADAGHMDDAVELVAGWCRARPVAGIEVSVHRLPGRTPVVVCDIPAFGGGSTGGADDTVLLYGHLDKQPPMSGWLDGLGPWTPVRRGDRLYGRGGADDGYAAFASLAAIEAVQAGGGRHARCVVVIEASEESGSPDLPAHIEALAPTIGEPSLVVCLDSGCVDYDRLWATTSLRGLALVRLRVDVLRTGAHSGSAGGVIPSSFRIVRALLDRIEDAATGELRLPALHAEVPADRAAELAATAAEVGAAAAGGFDQVEGMAPLHDGDPAAQLRARTWEPALATIGIDGVPPPASAGNVLRAYTELALSFRLPPTVDAAAAAASVVATLTADPPHGAHVRAEVVEARDGWNAPAFAPWLRAAVDAGSQAGFGAPFRTVGEGGSIPFMAMLGARFPAAQFLVTGVIGPGANAHGPNESLMVPAAVGVTTAVGHVLDAHARR
jgi:acetylornithine deacetylase/succinyl-diaminopimelate desuccinylase-like protein